MLVFQASPNIVIALAGNKADLTTNRIGEPPHSSSFSYLKFDDLVAIGLSSTVTNSTRSHNKSTAYFETLFACLVVNIFSS